MCSLFKVGMFAPAYFFNSFLYKTFHIFARLLHLLSCLFAACSTRRARFPQRFLFKVSSQLTPHGDITSFKTDGWQL